MGGIFYDTYTRVWAAVESTVRRGSDGSGSIGGVGSCGQYKWNFNTTLWRRYLFYGRQVGRLYVLLGVTSVIYRCTQANQQRELWERLFVEPRQTANSRH